MTGNACDSSGRPGTELPSPPKRQSTRYPGVYWRPDSKGNRRYQISYTDSAGNRIFKTLPKGTTEKEAVRERNQILERMHRGERVVRSRMTVKDLAEEYLRTQTAHLKPKTQVDYGYKLDHWVIPRMGHIKLSELGVHEVAEFITGMRAPTKDRPQGYKKWTIQGCLSPMSSMFRYAVRKGWMSSNPIKELERTERPKTDQREMLILSSDDISQLLPSVTTTIRPIIQAALFTGMRAGELLSLKWEDVDLANGFIKVRDSKTRAGIREIVIHEDLVKMLAEYNETTGLVFRTSNGTPYSQRNVLRALHDALDKAGLEKRGLHSLRHTYASWLISLGADVTYVANQMGHSNPDITLRLYAKFFDPERRKTEMREKMQAFVTSSVTSNGADLSDHDKDDNASK